MTEERTDTPAAGTAEAADARAERAAAEHGTAANV